MPFDEAENEPDGRSLSERIQEVWGEEKPQYRFEALLTTDDLKLLAAMKISVGEVPPCV